MINVAAQSVHSIDTHFHPDLKMGNYFVNVSQKSLPEATIAIYGYLETYHVHFFSRK